MAIRRSTGRSDNGVSVGSAFADPTFSGSFPLLFEFLTRVRWDDGKPRTPGTALAFSEGESVKICLSDKDAGEVAFVTARTWAGVWEAAELALEPGCADWRPMKSRRNVR